MIYETLHRKLKIEQHEPNQKCVEPQVIRQEPVPSYTHIDITYIAQNYCVKKYSLIRGENPNINNIVF